jgi:hypothetical protein
VTLSAAIIVSLVISLIMTPMMCATILRDDSNKPHGKLYRASERMFVWMHTRYETSLTWALGHMRIMLGITLATVVASVSLFMINPNSSHKMQLVEKLRKVAEACAARVVIPDQVTCCGIAGSKGFDCPELTASALAELKAALPADCNSGYSNSRTCEIGLSWHGGISYQSIVYLVDRCTSN